MPGSSLPVRVRDLRLDRDDAALELDRRLDGGDAPLEHLAGIGVEPRVDLLSQLDLGEVLLPDQEPHAHDRQVLQAGDQVAGMQILSQVDLADAEHAGERRGDDAPVDGRREGDRLGDQGIVFRLRVVQVALRDDPFLHQLPLALEVGLGRGNLRLRRLEVGLLLAAVQPDQRLADFHFAAGIEQDLGDDARFGPADIDPLHRLGHADRADLLLPFDLRHRGGGDVDGRSCGRCRRAFLRALLLAPEQPTTAVAMTSIEMTAPASTPATSCDARRPGI